MKKERISLYRDLEQMRNSKILVYATSDRPGFEAQIAEDALDYFIEQLDKIGPTNKISLFLYTRGGDTMAAWSIVNLIKQFCEEFEVIIPLKAHSSGTLISIGANNVVMTKQATLGPIDPSINTPLNPQIPGGSIQSKMPVSVEAVTGFLDLAKNELGINDEASLSKIYDRLSEVVHPLVLGQVYRTRSQIKMVAEKLLKSQVSDPEKVKKIIEFLCSESGSHDYTINRREAKDYLGLNIEKPTQEEYNIIKSIYYSIKEELELGKPFDPNLLFIHGSNQAHYSNKRVILESIEGGCDTFVSEGTLTRELIKDQNGMNQVLLNDNRKYEGWRSENNE
ncbi:SDH family Clp fold serine proteinase [Paraclostridium sordellii]|uniref:SDH family Clp fold serine proteinase n=1 Tax=Paraclostridium sordellii TaxID=1505 RepID=UPI0005E20AD9|nr:serine protease [Paeniclostridium sordellii]CEO23059.1 Serine dehydrogenase proteinase [[Clostridium] sordellii] [Paeniclostridium sordellii]